MKRSMYTVLTFVRINTKRFFRDRLALFFSIGFPLIFLFVFGSLNSGSGSVSFKVAVIDQANTSFSQTFVKQLDNSSVLKVSQDITTIEAAKAKMPVSVRCCYSIAEWLWNRRIGRPVPLWRGKGIIHAK